jgi:hypothetical protein
MNALRVLLDQHFRLLVFGIVAVLFVIVTVATVFGRWVFPQIDRFSGSSSSLRGLRFWWMPLSFTALSEGHTGGRWW